MPPETAALFVVVLLAMILLAVIVLIFRTATWQKALLEVLAKVKIRHRHTELADLLQRRSYEKAFEAAESKLESTPDDPELYWYKGISAFHMGKTEIALTALRRAVQLEPAFATVLSPYISKLEQGEADAV